VGRVDVVDPLQLPSLGENAVGDEQVDRDGTGFSKKLSS